MTYIVAPSRSLFGMYPDNRATTYNDPLEGMFKVETPRIWLWTLYIPLLLQGPSQPLTTSLCAVRICTAYSSLVADPSPLFMALEIDV